MKLLARVSSLLVTVLVFVGLSPRAAHANQIYASDCGTGGVPQTSFAPTDSVCVAGDVDLTCMVGPIMLPAADIYVVPTGADPLTGTMTHLETLGGFGSFFDHVALMSPLGCGTYDILLDERCDGVISGSDVLTAMAFTVEGPGCPVDAGPGDAGADADAGLPDAAPADTGVMDSAMADTGVSTPEDSSTPAPDAGEDSGGGTVDSTVAPPPGDDGGCGCRTVGARGDGWPAALLLLAWLIPRRRHRRRRRRRAPNGG